MNKNLYSEFLSDLFQGHEFEKYCRLEKIESLLLGSFETGKTGLSGMARGISMKKETNFSTELQNAFRFLNHPKWNDFDVALRLFHKLTKKWKQVVIAIDWTQVGRMMVLEACLVLEGRGIPFYCKSILKEDYKGNSSTMEFSMEYALLAMALPGQHLYLIADRGFAKLDHVGESELYPQLHRITRVKKNWVFTWDGIKGKFEEWPLYEGESIRIDLAIVGAKKKHQAVVGIVLSRCEQECYLIAPPHEAHIAQKAYLQRVGIEEQNRDLKTGLGLRSLYFSSTKRMQRLWNLLGILSVWMYQVYLQYWIKKKKILGRSYKGKRKDLSWFTFAQYLIKQATHLQAWIPFQQIWA